MSTSPVSKRWLEHVRAKLGASADDVQAMVACTVNDIRREGLDGLDEQEMLKRAWKEVLLRVLGETEHLQGANKEQGPVLILSYVSEDGQYDHAQESPVSEAQSAAFDTNLIRGLFAPAPSSALPDDPAPTASPTASPAPAPNSTPPTNAAAAMQPGAA
eukprot:CAMPEP_0113682768 /NCGR_PEP_ID=MMETSP0038_2-20120614/12872_1 /TAXON_ID=2898 /ORGANISM="Cryptomonas paramecium" /LENGTH=158 /DNA_ID=CAMNT_0000601925 /DNA_START=50 /DNA_END=522 /DNA_ORIENTATION=+ /assembly_acc=CAM_ASM_000170